MPRRIKRSSDKEDIYKSLTEGDYKVFKTMKDVFLFAASIGYQENKREVLNKVDGEIPWSVFRGDTDTAFIDSIAIAETKDIRILLSDEETYDKKFKILEEYANYGMNILRRKIIESPGDPIDNLVSLIIEYEDGKKKKNKLTSFVDELF
ncbi:MULTISPECIES: DNA phosphorothioation-associated protein 4 [Bacillus cereus group]|uniref:DNA phosphorothioation-associated protein 4 n=1 Tax=Bacillus cereus group TaxID=86661 RepID=UPI0011A43A8A|nr:MULTISPECIES: DNA phosphorothioation-associated protein 4 [Bacillus cereus group]MBK4743766.1 DNA phosphorothioation-associated protein 4 [Bacillus cereus]UTG82721.1 DNA phosphorothioation-associated protein 4 [Bacillus paranthracis]